jgi:hypothetical protein
VQRFTKLQDDQREIFFRFPRHIITDKIWAALPLASKVALPPIAVHMNQHGKAIPSEERIAMLCGRTEKTVRSGVRGLEDLWPGFRTENYVTRRGKRAKRYVFGQMPKDSKAYFGFRRLIIDGGNWHQLQATPTACALYPVMRQFSYCLGRDELLDDEASEDFESFDEAYRARAFDQCDADPAVLCEYAGISRNSLYPALQALIDACLIEPEQTHDAWYRVYLVPPHYFKREWLNDQLAAKGR